MAKILYSYVGELARFDDSSVVETPDGMRHCRPHLIDALLKRGHSVVAVQKRIEKKEYKSVEYDDTRFPSDADVLFCEWRWKTYKGSTQDLDRQDELLKMYHGQIPVILYDAAFQIREEDELKWPLAVIACPGINPRFLTRKRERLFFWSDFRTYFEPRDPIDLFNYGYIGNDYDRPTVFQRYYVSPATMLREDGVQTVVYGNWIDRSSARPNPSQTIMRTPNVLFCGRESYKNSMRALNGFISTTHLMKPLYDEHGNITIRFTETIAAGVPALVPSSFLDNCVLGHEWVVDSQYDVLKCVRALKSMKLNDRRCVIEEQKRNLLSRYDVSVDAAVSFIESYVGRTVK